MVQPTVCHSPRVLYACPLAEAEKNTLVSSDPGELVTPSIETWSPVDPYSFQV